MPSIRKNLPELFLLMSALVVATACQTARRDPPESIAADLPENAEYLRAIAQADRDLAANAKDADAYLIRAYGENGIGENAKAIADCDRSIALNATRDLAFSLRAGAKHATGDFDGAIADYDRALSLYSPERTTRVEAEYNTPERTIKVMTGGAFFAFHAATRIDPYFEQRALAVAARAMASADRAIARDPRDSAAFAARGAARHALGDHEGAYADFNHAISLDPQNPIAFRQRGLLQEIQSHFAETFTDETRAINRATGIILRNVNDAPAYIARGSYLANRGQYDDALADFERAIALAPDSASASIHRGRVRQAKGDPTGAVADFKQAIALADRVIVADPKNAHAFANRANAKQEAGDLRGAIVDFDRALELDPTDADVLLNRGLVKHQQGNHAAALVDFKRAAKILSPHDAVEWDAKSIREAVDDYPWDPSNWTFRGAFRYEQGDRVNGLDDIARALALVIYEYDRFSQRASSPSFDDRRQDDRFINRGASRFARPDHDRAMADYDRSIALKTNDAVSYFFRAVARHDQGDDSAALDDYDRAIALEPNAADALANRASIRWEKDNRADAMADLDRLIAIHPEDAEAYETRSMFKLRLDDQAGASADAKRSYEISGAFDLTSIKRPRRPSPLDPFVETPRYLKRPSPL